MVAEVQLSDHARADLAALDRSVQARVAKRLQLLSEEPRRGEPLGGALAGYWKFKVGNRDWRIVYEIVDDGSVLVWAVGRRDGRAVYEEASRRVRAMPPELKPGINAILDSMDEVEGSKPPKARRIRRLGRRRH